MNRIISIPYSLIRSRTHSKFATKVSPAALPQNDFCQFCNSWGKYKSLLHRGRRVAEHGGLGRHICYDH